MTAVRPGDRIELAIERVGHGGVCISHHEGQVVFVRHAIPGESVVAEITQVNSKFLRADAVEIRVASPHRVEPPCRYAGVCGGCDWQHVSVAHQRELKASVVHEQLRHVGGVVSIGGSPLEALQVKPIDGDPLRWRTRNRFQVTGPDTVGMYQSRAKAVVEIDDCLIARAGAVDAARTAAAHLRREVAVVSHTDGSHTVVDPRGGPIIEERVGERVFRVHASAFWQVHRAAPQAFVDAVADVARLQVGESLADLYSGSGLFTACLAGAVGESGRVVAVESVVDAVRDARRSMSDLPHVELVTADVATWLAQNSDVFDVVVLDPPRAGAGLSAISDLARAAGRCIVYVACEPSALARDVAALREYGWHLTSLTALDAFPMTSHVECIAAFHRSDGHSGTRW